MRSFLKEILFGPIVKFNCPSIGVFRSRIKLNKAKSNYSWSTNGRIGIYNDVKIELDGNQSQPSQLQLGDLEIISERISVLLETALKIKRLKREMKESEIFELVLIQSEGIGYFIEFTGDYGSSIFIMTDGFNIINVA